MRSSNQIREFWPLIAITLAIACLLPMLGKNPFSKSQARIEQDEPKIVGFQRAAGHPPLYGFDGVSLQAPIFRSWWTGKSAAAQLKELNSNFIVVGPIWRDGKNFLDTVARLHGAGVKIAVQLTTMSDWVYVRDNGRAPLPGTFSEENAVAVFNEAKSQAVHRFADFIVLDESDRTALSYANQKQRQRMYRLAKQFFPNLPVIRRYHSNLVRAEGVLGRPHPMGGLWDDYRFGPDECDIALIQIDRGLPSHQAGVKITGVLEQLNNVISIVKSKNHDVGVVISGEIGSSDMLSSTKTAMWSPKEIDLFVSAILTNSEIEGLVFRGLGTYSFDFGYPEFKEQRQAIGRAAPMSQEGDVPGGGEVSRVPASSR